MAIKASFLDDWHDIANETLKYLGHVPPTSDDLITLTMKFGAVQARILPPKKRSIRFPRVFDTSMLEVQEKIGLGNLKNAILKGRDLNPYTSKREIFNEKNKHDYLLNNWGIFHFHLGLPMSGCYKVSRTNHLVYVFMISSYSDEMFFLQISDHEHMSDVQLLKILYDNWPELLTPYIIKGFVGLSEKVSMEDRIKLWRGHVVDLVEIIPGVVVIPPGRIGGTTTAGIGINIVRESQKLLEHLRLFEIAAVQHLEVVYGPKDDEVDRVAKLKLIEGGLFATEEESGYEEPVLYFPSLYLKQNILSLI